MLGTTPLYAQRCALQGLFSGIFSGGLGPEMRTNLDFRYHVLESSLCFRSELVSLCVSRLGMSHVAISVVFG
jgi:hypothetical protein